MLSYIYNIYEWSNIRLLRGATIDVLDIESRTKIVLIAVEGMRGVRENLTAGIRKIIQEMAERSIGGGRGVIGIRTWIRMISTTG